MRKALLSLFLACTSLAATAQTGTVAGFDTLQLAHADTFYVNYNLPGTDVGFNDGLAHFPCYYDTSFGGLWSSGFAFSNMTDSVTSGYMNQYAAKAGKAFSGSNYAVYWQGYGANNKVNFHGAQVYKPQGFYITNSTYAYNSMRDGDFISRKFGDTTGTHSGLAQGAYPDWFKLTVYGYMNGAVKDSVEFYLADFRFANSAQDYIVNDWRWVNLQPLGFADSLDFMLTSSDVGVFGMNTPAYFCMDDFTVLGLTVGIHDPSQAVSARIYPNPATDQLFIETDGMPAGAVSVIDMAGRIIASYEGHNSKLAIPTAQLQAGTYILQLGSGDSKKSIRFIKQ